MHLLMKNKTSKKKIWVSLYISKIKICIIRFGLSVYTMCRFRKRWLCYMFI